MGSGASKYKPTNNTDNTANNTANDDHKSLPIASSSLPLSSSKAPPISSSSEAKQSQGKMIIKVMDHKSEDVSARSHHDDMNTISNISNINNNISSHHNQHHMIAEAKDCMEEEHKPFLMMNDKISRGDERTMSYHDQVRYPLEDEEEDTELNLYQYRHSYDHEEEDEEERRYRHDDLLSEPDAEETGSPRSETDAANAELFAVTAMSLGMESDDLLFNLMYFGGGPVSNDNFGSMCNTAMEETVALYSANNTPYKLRPAATSAIEGLPIYEIVSELEEDCRECLVCRDEMVVGDEMIRLPACSHMFHHECITRWLKLQGWCPVCRAPISSDRTVIDDHSNPVTSMLTQSDPEVEQDSEVSNRLHEERAGLTVSIARPLDSPCNDNYEKCMLSVCKSESSVPSKCAAVELFAGDDEEMSSPSRTAISVR